MSACMSSDASYKFLKKVKRRIIFLRGNPSRCEDVFGSINYVFVLCWCVVREKVEVRCTERFRLTVHQKC